MNDWLQLPSVEEVTDVYMTLAAAKRDLRIAQLELQKFQEEEASKAPHGKATQYRTIGSSREAKEALEALQQELTAYQYRVDVLSAQVEILQYRKDVYRAASYKLSY